MAFPQDNLNPGELAVWGEKLRAPDGVRLLRWLRAQCSRPTADNGLRCAGQSDICDLLEMIAYPPQPLEQEGGFADVTADLNKF